MWTPEVPVFAPPWVSFLTETSVLNGVEMRKRQQPHIEGPPEPPGAPRPSTCCLCWCGCCKCLWSEDRVEHAERQTCTKMDSIEATEEQHPTLEEVLSWSRSFEKMMHSAEGREVFREFLRSEYSEENLLFWLACEDLKKETEPVAIEEKARIIYEDYVSILSPKEVSLDSRVREGINQSLEEPSSHMYEEAQLQIYTLMHRDSFPRFLNSSVYRDLVECKRRACLET
ncbi:regulator of G-protein signaling 17-like isoform X1 [Arapaima gigas]